MPPSATTAPPPAPQPPPGGYKLVAFDMDGTLTVPRSCWAEIHAAFGSNNDEGLARYLAGELTDLEFVALDIRLWRAARGEAAVPAAAVKEVLETIPLAPGALETLRALVAANIGVVFITGGLDWLAQQIVTKALAGPDLPPGAGNPSPAFEVHANSLLTDGQGNLTGQGRIGVVSRDKGPLLQRIMARRGLRSEQVVAVGDGPVDVPLFQVAGLGVAVPNARPEALQAADLHLETDLRELLPPMGL